MLASLEKLSPYTLKQLELPTTGIDFVRAQDAILS
jgi:hypothetical protein